MPVSDVEKRPSSPFFLSFGVSLGELKPFVLGGFSDIFLFPEGIFKKEPNQRMKFRRTNKVGKVELKKVKKKGAVSKNVVRDAISPRSPSDTRP